MNHPDVLINVLGCLYGLVLVSATFLRTRLTEAMRIDALFIPQFSEKTRPLNLFIGVLVMGYGAYSLFTR